MYGLHSRAACNQERPMMARVRYIIEWKFSIKNNVFYDFKLFLDPLWDTEFFQTIGSKNKSLVNNSVNNSFEFQDNKTPHLMNRESKTRGNIYYSS